jgi:hypothetical protein
VQSWFTDSWEGSAATPRTTHAQCLRFSLIAGQGEDLGSALSTYAFSQLWLRETAPAGGL